MQVIEGTITMVEAVGIIKEKLGACFVEPITERQGEDTHTYFRVQHEVTEASQKPDFENYANPPKISYEALHAAYRGAMDDKAIAEKHLAGAEKRIRELEAKLGIGPGGPNEAKN